jgi:hypothetical protein
MSVYCQLQLAAPKHMCTSHVCHSLVAARHLAHMEATASAVAKGHDTHAVGDGLPSEALVPARRRRQPCSVHGSV